MFISFATEAQRHRDCINHFLMTIKDYIILGILSVLFENNKQSPFSLSVSP